VGRADELRERRLQYLCLRKKKASDVAKAESLKLGNNTIRFVFLTSLRHMTNVCFWIGKRKLL